VSKSRQRKLKCQILPESKSSVEVRLEIASHVENIKQVGKPLIPMLIILQIDLLFIILSLTV
jgi:hypothetical protein